jgi:parvulin-like peptidyl-prolyl isomerase
MRRCRLLALVALIAMVVTGCDSLSSSDAASVNGEKIAVKAFRAEVAIAKKNSQYGQVFEGTGAEAAQRDLLLQMIQQVLVNQEAKKAKISVAAGEVDKRIDDLTTQFGGLAALRQAAEQEGYTMESLRKRLTDSMVAEKLVDKVTSNLTVDEAAVRARYEADLATKYDQVHARHILVKTEDEAKAIRAQLVGGADFAKLAAEKSTDTSAKTNGGDLGSFGKGSMVAEFDTAVFAMKPNEISSPVQTQYGWHIIQLLERKTQTFEEVKDAIAKELMSTDRDEAFQKWLDTKLKKAEIQVNPVYGRWDSKTLKIVGRDTSPTQAPGSKTGEVPTG